MRPDSPVRSELTARPSRPPPEPNRCRTRDPAPVTSIQNASIARNNARARQERACDLCRRRKTKCDGPSAPDNICSNCVQNNQSCTYMCAYMHLFPSSHPSHLLLAKPLAQGVHQKRSFPLSYQYFPLRSELTYPILIPAMSPTSRTAWRRWKHCSRECVSHHSLPITLSEPKSSRHPVTAGGRFRSIPWPTHHQGFLEV